MVKLKGMKLKKDGALLIHPEIQGDVPGKDKSAGDSIKVPQIDTEYGAGFGDAITDSDRAFASEREPVAHFLTMGMAGDMTEKWFLINDPDTKEDDPELDRTVQNALTKLKFKRFLTEAIESERIYGKSLLVGGFADAQTVDQLKEPLKPGSELLQLAVYPSTLNGHKVKEWEVSEKDQDRNSERFGEPIIYKLHRDNDQLLVHYTRIVELKTRTNAVSVLDAIWDDMSCGRNIRWGAAQWLFRIGGGFPVIGFPAGTTAEQLETYHDSGNFANLHSRTAIFIAQNSKIENDGMTFDFKGASGHALDPIPFFKSNIEQISVATGIPQAKLVGAQAGAVTGSEVNVQDYYKVISREQAKLEDVIRWVIGKLADSGQLTLVKSITDDSKLKKIKAMLDRIRGKDYRHKTADQYEITWNSAFEMSEKDQAITDETIARANVNKLKYMTPDEVRKEMGLDPLPNGQGEKLQGSGFNLFGGPENKQGEFSPEELANKDKFLLIDLSPKGKQKDETSSSSPSSSPNSK